MPDTHDERGGDEAAEVVGLLRSLPRTKITPQNITQHMIDRWYREKGKYLGTIRDLRQQLAAATARAEKAEARLAELGEPETQLRIIGPSGAAYTPTGLDLQHRSDWLPGVRLEERQVYPTPWREAADAAQDGLSATETLQDPFGVAFHGNVSSITPQGLSEAEGGCPWCGTLQKLDADGLIGEHRRFNGTKCPGATRRPHDDDTTEDGQHG